MSAANEDIEKSVPDGAIVVVAALLSIITVGVVWSDWSHLQHHPIGLLGAGLMNLCLWWGGFNPDDGNKQLLAAGGFILGLVCVFNG